MATPIIEFPIWPNGDYLSFKWSKDFKAYIGFGRNLPGAISAICLGSRLAWRTSGYDSHELWAGSSIKLNTETNIYDLYWHCVDFGIDVEKATEWVRQASLQEAGHQLWGLNTLPQVH